MGKGSISATSAPGTLKRGAAILRTRIFYGVCIMAAFLAVNPLTAQTGWIDPEHGRRGVPIEDDVPLRNWIVPAPAAMDAETGKIIPMALPSRASHFIAIAPCRVVDTRSPAGPFGGPAFAANETRNYNIPGGPCAGIPSAAAYSLNFTVVGYDVSSGGFLTAYPSGGGKPFVSTVNFGNGINAVANAAIVPSNGGTISVYISGSTNLIIDINGYLAEGVVSSLNGLSDAVSLAAGTDLTLTPSAQTLTVAVSSTSANTFNTLIRRDGSGGFSAGTVALSGNLTLPASSSSTAGALFQSGTRLLHTFGPSNVFLGLGAGNFTMSGASNTGVGASALSSNTTGANNTASGLQALGANTNGSNNTAFGTIALRNNPSASDNTAIGARALFSNIACCNTAGGTFALTNNTIGTFNTAFGAFALQNNTTGLENTASGYFALISNTTGSENTAIGVRALQFNTAGGNTALGHGALSGNTTDEDNTAIGDGALLLNTTGGSNIAVGSAAGANLGTGNDNIAIGSYGETADTRTIRIGRPFIQNRTFVAGVRGITTGLADGATVLIDSNDQLGTINSSASLKRDIISIGEQSTTLMKLRPVSFFYRSDTVGFRQYGLIAEEVAEVMPELVQFSPTGEAQTVRYHFLPPLLLSEIQKQEQTIQKQEVTIDDQRTEIRRIQARLTALEKRFGGLPGPGD